MQVTREELNPCTIRLSIIADPAEVKNGFERAYKQIAKEIKLPGFRPGHAPRSMIESVINPEKWHEEAAEHIVRNTYKSALEQENLQPDPTTRPMVDLTKLDRTTLAAEYTVKVPLPPRIELGDYKSLVVEQESTEVKEEEIDRQIDEFRKGRGKREAITDRGAVLGDIAVVAIKVEGDAGDGRVFMTVLGQTNFDDLNNALTGMKVEEMKNVELNFPENFQDKEWAGTKIQAQVTLNSLSAVQLPTLDDEFAKSLAVDNVEDLRNRLREAIGQAKIQISKELMTEKLLEQLQSSSKISVSDNMWEDLAQRRMVEQSEEQAKAGKTLQQYAEENGMSVEQLHEAWKEKAKLHVERALIIREIFTQEGMQLTNQELNVELFEMAKEYELEPEEMLKTLQENQALDELQYRSISRKVADYLLKTATIGTVPAVSAEATVTDTPEEKPKAKKSKKSESAPA